MTETLRPEQLLADAAWLKRLAFTLAGNADDAEDLVQESWIATWKRRPDTDRPLRPWLAKVVRDLAKMRRRGARRRAAREEAVEQQEVIPPDALLEQMRLHRLLVDLVLELDEGYRTAIIARYVEGRSAASIARSLGIPESTVRGRLRDGLAHLRTQLDKRNGNRKAWAPAVLAFGQKGFGVATSTKTIAVVAALLALIAGTAVLVTSMRHANDEARPDRRVNRAGPDHSAPSPRLDAPSWFAQVGVAAKHVAGRVTFDGAPVAGALVTLRGFVSESERRTASDGTFDLGLQVATHYDITASLVDRVATIVHLNLASPLDSPPPDRLELRLVACSTSVSGVVVDANGNPVPHARVSREQLAGVEADERGAYRICVPRGEVALRYAAENYGAVVRTVDAQGRSRQDVVLVPDGSLNVLALRDDDGHPVTDAIIVVSPKQWGADHPAGAQVSVNTEGRAHLGGLLPGEYFVTAFSPRLVGGGSAHVSVGSSTEVVLRLRTTARVHGVVSSGGTPIAGAEIGAIRESPWNRSSFETSRADGTFWLERVPLGDISFLAAPYRVVSPTTLHIRDATTYEVVLDVARLGSIAGRVTRRGVPAAGAQVCCVRDLRGTSSPAIADGDGHYEIRGITAGTYDLQAQTSEAFMNPVKVTLRDGESRTVDLELGLAGAITGSVVDQDGVPVGGVFVRWLRAETGDYGKCMTDDDGGYRCGALSGHGTYQASVFPTSTMQTPFPTANDHAYPTVEVAVGASVVGDMRIVIASKRYAIHGHVLDDAGQPVADARVTALAARGDQPPAFWPWLRLPTTFTDADGAFAVENLAVGTYALRAQSTSGAEGITPTVTAGADNIVLHIARTATVEGTLVGFTTTPVIYARQLSGAGRGVEGTLDGSTFRIIGLNPGRYIVSGETAREGDAQTIELRSGQSAAVTLTSHGTASIEGHVLDFRTRMPIAGAACHAASSADGIEGLAARQLEFDPRSDATGVVRIDPAPAGSVMVTCAMPSGHWSTPTTNVVLAAGDHARAQLLSVEVLADQFGAIGVELSSLAAIVALQPNGAAALAGAQVGDQIVAVDGADVSGLNGFGVYALIGSHAVGTDVALTVSRQAQRRTLTVKVGPPPQ